MKAKITVTGTLDLSRGDIKTLRGVSAGHVLDTMRYEAKDLEVEIEGPEERTRAKAEAKAKAKAKTEAPGQEESHG